MKICTKSMDGNALIYAVCLAEGYAPTWYRNLGVCYYDDRRGGYNYPRYLDWAEGGPILEREGISTTFDPMVKRWRAIMEGGDSCHADAPLVAALRCLVLLKLGEEVDIPQPV